MQIYIITRREKLLSSFFAGIKLGSPLETIYEANALALSYPAPADRILLLDIYYLIIHGQSLNWSFFFNFFKLFKTRIAHNFLHFT